MIKEMGEREKKGKIGSQRPGAYGKKKKESVPCPRVLFRSVALTGENWGEKEKKRRERGRVNAITIPSTPSFSC